MIELLLSPDARQARARAGTPPVSHELWRLRGATDDLRGLAVETSFGHALGLELDAELVLLHLQPSLDALLAYAARLEAALRAQGWQRVPSSSLPSHKECA